VPSRRSLVPALVLALIASFSSPSEAQRLEVDDLAGPAPELAADAGAAARLALPALPSFELPAAEPGFTSARELQLRGRRKLGTEVKVKGYVTWIYDCAAALAAGKPKARRAAIQRSIDEDPTLCERHKLTIADARGAARDASLPVVEVPRPPNKMERQRLPKDELARWPAVPKVAVGDYVMITGQWTTRAPHGDADSDGLLVYGALERAPPPAAGTAAPAAPAAAGPAAGADAEPAIAVVRKAPLRMVVPAKVRAASIQQLGECLRWVAARDLQAAVRACNDATVTWAGNHLAWYTLSSTYMALGQWVRARITIARAVGLRPDLAMYQLYHGVALYEEELHAVAALASAAGTNGEDALAARAARPDVTSSALPSARDALRRAIELNPALWRAHFYLARVHRDLEDSRRAAEQLVATIKTHPSYPYAYLALAELLRRWGELDAALAFLELGAQQVPGADAADLWIEVGLLRENRRAGDATHAQSLEAYAKALAARPGDTRALLQRGQLLYRNGDHAGARRDLEATRGSADPQVMASRAFIDALLAKIAAKKR
jgi:tetratricopeptide (TPR) repeat protein